MPYTNPTQTEFIARFPEFTDVPETKVSEVIAEAAFELSDEWDDDKRAVAHKLLTAHYLAMEGEPNRSKAIAAGRSPAAFSQQVASRKVGDVSTTFVTSGGSDRNSDGGSYSSTLYGKRYWQLAESLTLPAVAVT